MLAIPSVRLIFLIFAFNIILSVFAGAAFDTNYQPPTVPTFPEPVYTYHPTVINEETGEIITPAYTTINFFETVWQYLGFPINVIIFFVRHLYPKIPGLPSILHTIIIVPLYIVTTYILLAIILWLINSVGQFVPF